MIMTNIELQKMGYSVTRTTPFEVTLFKNGSTVRKWWIGTFGHRPPDLGDQVIRTEIESHERYLTGQPVFV